MLMYLLTNLVWSALLFAWPSVRGECTTLLLKGGSYAQAFSMAVGVGHVVLASGSSVPVADRLATGESAGSSAWTEPYGTWSLPFLFMTMIWMVSVKAIAQQCRQHVQPAVS